MVGLGVDPGPEPSSRHPSRALPAQALGGMPCSLPGLSAPQLLCLTAPCPQVLVTRAPAALHTYPHSVAPEAN